MSYKTIQPEISKYREYLEKQIISSAFFFPEAAFEMTSILSKGNFALKISQEMFQIIKESLDRGEAKHDFYIKEFNQKYPKENIVRLTEYMEHYITDNRVREKCIILLEIDIREKFGTALKQNELVAVASQDFEKATMWKQCHDYILDPNMDVFESIPRVEKYLENYSKDELEEFKELKASIPKVIDRVRGAERARRFIDTITRLASSPDMESERRECVEILKDLMVTCVSRLPLPENLSSTLNELKRNAWQLPQKSPHFPNF